MQKLKSKGSNKTEEGSLYSAAAFPALCLAFIALFSEISDYSLAFAVTVLACGDNMQCKWMPRSTSSAFLFLKHKTKPSTRTNDDVAANSLRNTCARAGRRFTIAMRMRR